MSVRVRSVNGYGPRCGCGGKSALHLTNNLHVTTPETSRFLCAECLDTAVMAFLARRPAQPAYWPGDEERDEPYERPVDAPGVVA